MKKVLLPLVMSLMLCSCGGSSSHPLVGNKYTLSSTAAIASYDSDLTEKSFFGLIDSCDSDYGTFAKLDALYRGTFVDGYFEISDSVYEENYICYASSTRTTIFGVASPADSKGVDTEKVNLINSSTKEAIVLRNGISTMKLFSYSVAGFAKVDSGYQLTAKALYEPETFDHPEIQYTATFIYTFTLA